MLIRGDTDYKPRLSPARFLYRAQPEEATTRYPRDKHRDRKAAA